MTGDERRYELLNFIKTVKVPVSGQTLAKKYQVSRQVIVQDIALLRAANCDIFSTTKGYLIHQPQTVTKVITVTHTDEQIEEELNIIVDMGGRVLDVFVDHEVYGLLRADLGFGSRRAVKEFVEDINSGKSSPLKNLTSGKHYHTIEADSEQVLDLINEELEKKGFVETGGL